MSKKVFYLVLLPILSLGLILRWRNLGNVPLPGQSQDEYSNAWVGMSIIESGVPVGMSGMKAYSVQKRVYINPDRIFQQSASGDATTLNYPWFDHPPLVPLITGGFAYFKGARVFEDVSAVTIRKPVAALSAVTMALIGILASQLFGPAVGLFAALFYAIAPLTTVMNRMVQAENFFVPLGLFSLLCFFRFSKAKEKRWWYLGVAGLMAGVLVKLSFIAFVVAAILLLKQTVKKSWPWVTAGIFVLAALSWWVIYGLALSPSTFANVLLSNSERAYGIGYQAVADLVTTVKVTGTKTIADGWVLASFLGMIALMASEEKNKRWIVLPFLSYLSIFLFFGGESFGWYRLPFFPFTFIALGYLTVELVKKANPSGLLLFLVPLGVSATRVIPTDGIWLVGWRIIPMAIVLIGYLVSDKRVNRLILATLVAVAVLVSVIYNLKIDVSLWYKIS